MPEWHDVAAFREKIMAQVEARGYVTTLYQNVRPAGELIAKEQLLAEGKLVQRLYKTDKYGFANSRGRKTRAIYFKPGVLPKGLRISLLPKSN